VGQFCIPVGTVLAGVAGPSDGLIAAAPSWGGMTLPVSQTVPMPIDAVAIDSDAAVMMFVWFQPPPTFGTGWYSALASTALRSRPGRWRRGWYITGRSPTKGSDDAEGETDQTPAEAEAEAEPQGQLSRKVCISPMETRNDH
jgi:hypothetical protein